MGDITTFMTWFIEQVVNIFSYVFNTLNGITFANTSMLKIIITITILSALLPVILTIANTRAINRVGSERRKKNDKQPE